VRGGFHLEGVTTVLSPGSKFFLHSGHTGVGKSFDILGIGVSRS